MPGAGVRGEFLEGGEGDGALGGDAVVEDGGGQDEELPLIDVQGIDGAPVAVGQESEDVDIGLTTGASVLQWHAAQ